jgi:hypothetical protein
MNKNFPHAVGSKVVIRTVTYHHVGVVKDVGEGFVILSDASWIADSGRWGDFLRTGNPSESEKYPGDCVVYFGAMVDSAEFDAKVKLPTETK